MRPLRIGLTGGIGVGKTTVSDLFQKRGVPVLDADRIARDLVAPRSVVLGRIVERLGPEILKGGELDRGKLREIIFSDPKSRSWLEGLLHPLIYSEMALESEKIKAPYVVWVIPLLLETQKQDLVDRVLVVHADPGLQVSRVMKRDGVDAGQVQAILKAQIKGEERMALADDVILNAGDLEALESEVEKLHRQYLAVAAESFQSP